MATVQQQLQIYQQWFTLADEDRDGAIAGAEAVKFFGRSGLDQMTLSQVWNLASGGGPKLNNAQFTSAMRLVALAQANAGRLPPEQANVIKAGMGPPLPLARMAGLEQYGAPQPGNPAAPVAGYTPQATGAYPSAPGYPPQPGAPGPAVGYAPQATGAYPGAPAYPPTAASQPGAPAPLPGAASGVAAGPTGGWPPATAADLQRYQAAFAQLDGDRDGLVQGSDCFTLFMQWGLDKSVLRHIWDIVAGNSSALNQQQLTACLYLMDAAKRGLRPPTQLPPGPFPPVAQQWSLKSQFGGTSVAASAPATSQQAMVLPSMPVLGAKYAEPEQGEAGGPPRPSAVPTFGTSIIGSLAGDQRDKLTSELKEAADRESRLFTVEEKAAQTKARAAAYNAAMQEITVFKSRTDVAMLQAQDQLARLEEELVVTRAKYDKAYASAATQSEAARKLREHLGQLMTDKTEAEGRLLHLEGEIAAASAVTPADVARMEAEVAALRSRVAEQEAIRDSKSSVLAGIRAQKAALEARLAEVDAARSSAEAEVRDAQKAVTDLQSAITSARAEGGTAALAPLVSKAAELYRGLYTALTKAGNPVPFDCLPANLELAAWMDDAMAGVTDWNDLDNEARGYALVNALPGQRLEANRGKANAGGAAAGAGGAAPGAGFGDDAFGEAPAFGGPPAAAPALEATPTAAMAVDPPSAPAAEPLAAAPPSGPVPDAAPAPAPAAPPAAAPAAAPPPPAATPAAGGFGFDDDAFA